MTKKLLSIFLLGLLAGNASATETVVVPPVMDYFVPFVQGEAAYTWHNTKPVEIFGHHTSIHKHRWGGRVAAGVSHAFSNCFGYTYEIGWGYYGHTNSSNTGDIPSGVLSVSNRSDLYGFDILAGVFYNIDAFQVFFKAGAMAENRRIKGHATFTNLSGATIATSTNTIRSLSTNVLPEIKVGGMYYVMPQLAVSLAYMHVFGNNKTSARVTGAFANPQATAGISSVVNVRNPSLNSILFGLVWQFC